MGCKPLTDWDANPSSLWLTDYLEVFVFSLVPSFSMLVLWKLGNFPSRWLLNNGETLLIMLSHRS